MKTESETYSDCQKAHFLLGKPHSNLKLKALGFSLTEIEALQSSFKHKYGIKKDMLSITEIVSKATNIPLKLILSRNQVSQVTTSRHIMLYLCHYFSIGSNTEIEQAFGRNGRSIVNKSVNRVLYLKGKYIEIEMLVNNLEKECKQSLFTK